MRSLVILLSGLLVMSGLLSVKLWKDLQTERNAIATSLNQAPGEQVSSGSSRLASRSAAAGSATAQQAVACNVDAEDDRLPTEEFVARMEALVAKIPATILGTPQDKDLMRDEEYRRARLAQVRITEAYSNPGLADALGLSEAEANSLFERMAQHQVDAIAEISNTPKETLVGAALFDMTRRHGVAQENQVRAQLGETRYALLQDYRRDTRPGLLRLANISNMLLSAGHPLSDAQSQALAAVVQGEQQRRRQQASLPASRSTPAAPKSPAQAMEESQNRREAEDRSFLEAMAPNLTAAQLEVLRKQLEQQGTTNRRNLEIAKGG